MYQLKELEKLGPKLKGIGESLCMNLCHRKLDWPSIVSQSVKEVLQSLVDDGHVQAEKIGASNCMMRMRIYSRSWWIELFFFSNSFLEFSVTARCPSNISTSPFVPSQKLHVCRSNPKSLQQRKPSKSTKIRSQNSRLQSDPRRQKDPCLWVPLTILRLSGP